MKIAYEELRRLTKDIFSAAGCADSEAECISSHLVESNLVGHDSHGVIRVPYYIEWLRDGKVYPNKKIKVVFENDVIAVVDGDFGFGQSIGEQAMALGIEKAGKHGVAVVALRNTGHLGRIGDWALACARANKLSMHFVNTSGAGILVAPFGGIERRLSANPIAAGVPVDGGEPILLDMSACTLAEGKLKVALDKGVPVPDNCIIDAEGKPTNDPKVFYGDPPGAILSVGGHKGYGLGIIAEMLAGALTGGSCSNPVNAKRVANGMLSVILDRKFFQSDAAFSTEAKRFIDYVKSSKKSSPDTDILMPGEIEERTKKKRLREGIDLAETTWKKIGDVCRSLEVPFDS